MSFDDFANEEDVRKATNQELAIILRLEVPACQLGRRGRLCSMCLAALDEAASRLDGFSPVPNARRLEMSEYIHPLDRRDPNWMSAAEESRQEINENLERVSEMKWPRGRCEFWITDRVMCGKAGRWMKNNTIYCGEHVPRQ